MTRKDSRYPSMAQVHIAEILNSESVLKDLSMSGCCIQSDNLFDIAPHTRYTIEIIPEEDAALEQFELDIESRWIRTKKTYSQSGFIIVVPPGSMILQQYIDYLAKRNKKLVKDE